MTSQPQPRPSVHHEPGLPERVHIYEVGPRDGLQAEAGFVPTEAKRAFVQALRAAGLPTVEATSFVSPRWVPQLADASEVLAGLDGDLRQHPVLTPNLKGLERALAAGAQSVAVFVSATESFAQRNLNMTRRAAIDAARQVTAAALAEGLTVRGYVSMCFGDPWEGPVEPGTVAAVSHELLDAGVYEVSLGDTIGVGTAGHVRQVVQAHHERELPTPRLALHFHDTYGQALANVHAGLQAGVTTFDSSASGLGGCPFAMSATGNLPTEDLVWLLSGLGIETGVDLAKVVAAGDRMNQVLGRTSQSRVAAALAESR